MVTTRNITAKKLPVFTPARCKQCGICSHFCPTEAIEVHPDAGFTVWGVVNGITSAAKGRPYAADRAGVERLAAQFLHHVGR